QFRDGKIIDALAEINRMFVTTYADTDPTLLASALLDWWQTSHSGLPKGPDGSDRSPDALLRSVSERDFTAAVEEAGATSSFVAPSRMRSWPVASWATSASCSGVPPGRSSASISRPLSSTIGTS